MSQVVVVGVDDSPGAVAAVEWAERHMNGRIAQGQDCAGVLVAAWSRPVLDSHAIIEDALSEDMANEALSNLERTVSEGSRFEFVSRRGPAANVVLAEAGDRDADLIVVGTRGRGPVAQVLLGSVSRSVAARADRPVTIVPDPAKRSPRGSDPSPHTIVCFDGSAGAKEALRWALSNTVGKISAVCAWMQPNTPLYDPTSKDAEAVRAAAEGVMTAELVEVCGEPISDRVTPVLAHGDVRNVVLELAQDASCVVIGARRYRGLKGLLLGSSVTYIACHASVPVVVVPPSETAEEEEAEPTS